VRRKFFDVKDYSPVECEKVLAMIAKLFAVGKKMISYSQEELKVYQLQMNCLSIWISFGLSRW